MEVLLTGDPLSHDRGMLCSLPPAGFVEKLLVAGECSLSSVLCRGRMGEQGIGRAGCSSRDEEVVPVVEREGDHHLKARVSAFMQPLLSVQWQHA